MLLDLERDISIDELLSWLETIHSKKESMFWFEGFWNGDVWNMIL